MVYAGRREAPKTESIKCTDLNKNCICRLQGQPALLYLVPCTLMPFALLAWRRGELAEMWEGPGWSAAIERGRTPLHSGEMSGEWGQDIEESGGVPHDVLREERAQQSPNDSQGGGGGGGGGGGAQGGARSRGGGVEFRAGGRGNRGDGMAGVEVATEDADDMRQGLL